MKRMREMVPMAMEDRVYLPSMSFNADEVPDIKSCEVGQEYECKVKLRMTGYNENKSLKPDRTTARGEFDIVGIEFPAKK